MPKRHGGSNPSSCAIKTNTIPRGWCLFLSRRTRGREPTSATKCCRMGFAYPTRRSKSSLFRRRVWVSSLKTNIPLPAPNKRTTEPQKLCCFLFLWHWYERILTPLCDSPSRRMGFAFERKPSVSSLTSGGAKNLRQRRIPRNERQC